VDTQGRYADCPELPFRLYGGRAGLRDRGARKTTGRSATAMSKPMIPPRTPGGAGPTCRRARARRQHLCRGWKGLRPGGYSSSAVCTVNELYDLSQMPGPSRLHAAEALMPSRGSVGDKSMSSGALSQRQMQPVALATTESMTRPGRSRIPMGRPITIEDLVLSLNSGGRRPLWAISLPPPG